MHDIWNPWHGCIKKSEGCKNCYMYFLDKSRNQDGSKIFKVAGKFDYPIQRDKNGEYKVKSGEQIRVCMTSDFFLEQADMWRNDAWNIISQRKDVVFLLLTKRPERVEKCLPSNWGDGWENVFFNVTTENQKRADERIPILLDLPFKHKGIMVAPFLDKISIDKYLQYNQIEQVVAGGENYDGARPTKYEWVKDLYEECKRYNITFCFAETGNIFIMNGKTYRFNNKRQQSVFAYNLGLQYQGKAVNFKLEQESNLFSQNIQYKKFWSKNCENCGMKMICNGCSRCGKCGQNFNKIDI